MEYYKLLKKLSERSDHPKHKMSCIIIRKGKIIGKGFNMLKTHPSSEHKWQCRHAEFNAFISADRNIEGATVHIFRENNNGVLSHARPCPSCYKLLMENEAKLIVYSFEGSYKTEKLK